MKEPKIIAPAPPSLSSLGSLSESKSYCHLGRFISLEGGEGAGKSTQMQVVQNWLKEHALPFVSTREPGGTPEAEYLRHFLLDSKNCVSPMAELLVVFAARAVHLEHFIWPHLKKGTWVVTDRFTDSTYAYQASGRGLTVAQVEQLENWVQGAFRPDLTLLYDLPETQGLGRIDQRNLNKQTERDRIEQESAIFFSKVRHSYLERAQAYPERIKVIDASQDLIAVTAMTRQVLDTFWQAIR